MSRPKRWRNSLPVSVACVSAEKLTNLVFPSGIVLSMVAAAPEAAPWQYLARSWVKGLYFFVVPGVVCYFYSHLLKHAAKTKGGWAMSAHFSTSGLDYHDHHPVTPTYLDHCNHPDTCMIIQHFVGTTRVDCGKQSFQMSLQLIVENNPKDGQKQSN
ncbi:hypothetical protein D9757_013128 [Collybiopsis confluens]|uniref:Uncharacterized protein n=1 Tax=Collybiopsis confluens TaxID=2823264 RepID=A0A8H5GSW7_9AGAR|nr:hypothetical protein D9757_013128 [Collybiopsis confluens]